MIDHIKAMDWPFVLFVAGYLFMGIVLVLIGTSDRKTRRSMLDRPRRKG